MTWMQNQISYAREYGKRFPNVVRAQWKVANAVLNGKLKPVRELVCKDCGSPARAYDHRDYFKPLEVDPVCHRCNSLRGPGLNRATQPAANA